MRGLMQRKSLNSDPTKFFDNLMNTEQLLEQLRSWLGRDVKRVTLYSWMRKGMPSVKLRSRRYFKRDEIALWLQRSS
jgi:hypothetical protein